MHHKSAQAVDPYSIAVWVMGGFIVHDSTSPQKTEKRCHIYLILRLQFPLLNKPDNKPRQGCSLAAEPVIYGQKQIMAHVTYGLFAQLPLVRGGHLL